MNRKSRRWALRAIAPLALPLALAAGALSFGTIAQAAIQVSSTIVGAGETVRGQAVITDPTSFDFARGVVVTAISVKEFRAEIHVHDDGVVSEGGPSLLVKKHQLTAAEAYGFGLPMGYTQPPFTDPQGPWQGLCWPYRDQYDYFANPGDPLADNVGQFFTADGNVYGFLHVNGIARGGPTDPVGPPGSSSPSWLNRGLTGNGADPAHPATYFMFDIISQLGDPNRFVTIEVLDAFAVVVTKDSQGNYGEMTIPVDDFTVIKQVPEPTMASVLVIGALALRRRRTRTRS